jgi:hypothetical protein
MESAWCLELGVSLDVGAWCLEFLLCFSGAWMFRRSTAIIPSGFCTLYSVFFFPMFDIVKPQIATAADKTNHLRRFL